ncbi:type II toxin-antitoxin system YafQ family toxin [Lactiplantibacillus plantarum]|uniref:type II toxin-antitoxin system YafQ family toxin n=1 Tax=Lactiplantibacillus plantarum TaxID=1590 RepID=UPI000977777F|nr:type II toxin-antitoxin system YafQ family toxin [Lactiplantibacillus plantarum]TLQ24586.1 type II toxin-antitoxin system YafQ family toxin [Lactiplantibacillus plantarum]TXJ65589.1 type II toxin-antitoxin system YafQ family toxin [Lactiplantibacillus plantarum]TXJ69544.1 type II toxin-antitoxin system YafQ family toxin [Lactiplantibacillus plantarum]TXJ91309.1 type II toxin-antitoxin system YafQ family toxin [Lactiplantibacillus plantarum]
MQIKQTRTFERELKRLAKKHFPITILKPCLKAVVEQDALVLKRIKDHALKGKWRGYRESHPARYGSYGKKYDSWIVIYQLDHNELVLLLVATGSHEILNQ